MSFLHGVLETVKEDDNVTTYDNNDINNVINTLNTSVGKGREAFGKALTQVEERTGAVKTKLGELIGKLSSDAGGQYFQEVKNRGGEGLEKQLNKWKTTIQRIEEDVTDIEKQQINILDKSLSTRIMNEYMPVKKVVAHLGAVATNPAFGPAVKAVDSEFMKQEEHVTQEIQAKSAVLRDAVTTKFDLIDKSIRAVEKTQKVDLKRLMELVGELAVAVGEADKVSGTLVRDYQRMIVENLESINEHVQPLATETIANELNQVYKSITSELVVLDDQLRTIGSVGQKVTGLVENKLAYIESELSEKIKVLKGDIRNNVEEYSRTYIGSVMQQIGLINEKVGEPMDGHADPKNRTIYHNWEVLDARTTGLIKRINGSGTDYNGLKGIQHRLEYAVQAAIAALSATARQNAKTIWSFTTKKTNGSNMFDFNLGFNLEAAIAQVDQIKEIHGGDADNGVEPGDKITKALKEVKQKIETLLENLTDATKKSFAPITSFPPTKAVALTDKIDARVQHNVDPVDFDTPLKALLNRSAKEGVNMLDTEIKQILNGQLGTVKPNIEAEINTLKRDHTGATSGEIQQKISELQDKITRLISSVGNVNNKAKSEIKSQVTSVQKQVGNLKEDITKINLQITAFNASLQKVIEEAQSTVDDARETLQRQINETQTALTEAAEQAFKEVYTKVKSTFAEGHLADLEALHKLVTDQKTQIDKIIAKDNRKGLKGFFDKLLRTVLDHEKDLISKSKVTAEEHKFVKEIKEFLHVFFTSVYIQNDFVEFESSFNPIVESTHDMLQQLEESKRFDHTFIKNLDNLNLALHNFEPKKFSEPCSILLDALKDGLNALASQLGYAYVSSYDGAPPIASWEYRDRKSKKTLPTEEAKMCAKVFLTCLPMCFNDLTEIRKQCNHDGDWRKKCINLSNELGAFFEKCGYRVSEDDGSHRGDLKNNADLDGRDIHRKLMADIAGEDDKKYHLVKDEDDENPNGKANNKSLLKQLVDHLHSYYAVTQLRHIDGAKPPTNIFQMLCWVTGLWYSPVRRSLCSYFNELFDKPKGMEDRAYKDIDPRLLKLVGTSTIRPRDLTVALHSTCSYAENVLVAILGTGHADGIYACEFSTNDINLLYPTNMTTLICLLMNVVKRLHSQLHFLYTMCSYETELSGWRDCTYGSSVGGSNWQCNTLTYAEQTYDQQCNQRANQNTNQTANQPCNQHPKCGLKSPLQSFLEDGLQGFLPHNVTANGSSLSCTNCPKRSGQPCKTPMGFGDISITASRRHTGQFIFDAIGEFCGGASSHLSNLCNLLNALLPAAPKTLGEMFAFYYNFVAIWHANGSNLMDHRDTAFNNAVVQANFGNPNTELNITPLFMSTDHGTMPDLPHPNGDLYSLIECKRAKTTTAVHPCGPYLRPLCVDICSIFSDKHVNKYLSWVVYVTETFYDLLKKLYDDCCKTCGGDKPKCRKAPCSQKCNVGRKPTNSNHSDSCISIVNCQTTMPTLCRYGFTFGYSSDLAGTYEPVNKRTCRDFCNLLNMVLQKGNALGDLTNITIPNFLLEIRWPFMCTLLALWSLSLLYLLHIAVVRLDVLRIRSHLRSPSSHRIAAQSLLAAARVKALPNVKYFSP
ncbi:hypothetical protein, conserved [Babesia ovata]|uniref:Uncharacterized protein n=1 Tax=Babesia ovata TaxID=189622 RepID=A0A2H6KJ43_9APIC|nr:uncharacterized protein BOVATA_045070 [Babesia ovata]GBE63014.1 hypothetical protein, conserved [Babesia ovata]